MNAVATALKYYVGINNQKEMLPDESGGIYYD